MAKKKNQHPSEERELEQAYTELTGYDLSATRKKKSILLPLLALIMFLIAALAGCALGLGSEGKNTEPSTQDTTQNTTQNTTVPEPVVSDGITAGGVDLSGMNEEAVRTALEAVSEVYETTDMTVRIEDSEYTLTATGSGAKLDVDAAVTAILDAAPGEFDLAPYLQLDQEYILQYIDEWDSLHTIAAVTTAWSVTGEMPSLAPSDEEPVCQNLVLVKGITGCTMDRDALYQSILEAYKNRSFLAEGTVTPNEPEVFDITTVHAQYYIAPVDAVMDMTTFDVSDEVYGYTFDTEAAQTAWDAAAEGEEITIPFSRVTPELSAESLSSILFRDELASYKTKHTNNANRNNNLKKACKSLNGLVIYPGETFSYNKALGKRTLETGYLPAGAYSDGQVVESVGGGICQVSSTLYNAVLEADLKIVYRINHGMTVSYLPAGLDATVEWGSVDFKFKNNTNYPIRLEAKVSGGYVRISIIGTDERDYYVEMKREVNETYKYETIYREMYADNEEGYKDGDVIISPYTGYKVTTYRCKYDKETGKLISKDKEAVSTYKKIDKVVAKIIEDPTKPTETPTQPTEPPTEPTEPPTQPTEPPTEPTDPPTEPTDPPTEPTDPPAEPTDPPTEPTDPPTEPADPPTDPSEPEPSETTEPTP